MEKAILLDQNNVEYLNELGSQKISQEKIKDAIKCYSNALRKEETNTTALLGRLKCQILEEKLDEVEKQFELLSEALPAITTNPVKIYFIIHFFF
jgi:tetratricopeptide (TPR) repeat protein